MIQTGNGNTFSRKKKGSVGLLVLLIVGSLMISCLMTAEICSSPPTATANSQNYGKAPSYSYLDPDAYLNGFHLYNVTNWWWGFQPELPRWLECHVVRTKLLQWDSTKGDRGKHHNSLNLRDSVD